KHHPGCSALLSNRKCANDLVRAKLAVLYLCGRRFIRDLRILVTVDYSHPDVDQMAARVWPQLLLYRLRPRGSDSFHVSRTALRLVLPEHSLRRCGLAAVCL